MLKCLRTYICIIYICKKERAQNQHFSATTKHLLKNHTFHLPIASVVRCHRVFSCLIHDANGLKELHAGSFPAYSREPVFPVCGSLSSSSKWCVSGRYAPDITWGM